MPDPDFNLAVSCRGLHKHFGSGDAEVAALRGVDLDIRRGELLMLVGPSGCGKTTLVSLLTGLLEPDAGQCRVLGQDLSALPADERARFRGRTIGLVFQAFNLLPALDARANVSVPLLLQGIERGEAQARAAAMLDAVGLADRLHAVPARLSGGQQQRVAIARALVHAPALLVCDEPTSNLDHQAGQAMMALLAEVARTTERAVLVVTHDPRIFAYADRIARMEDGRIVAIGPPDPAAAA